MKILLEMMFLSFVLWFLTPFLNAVNGERLRPRRSLYQKMCRTNTCKDASFYLRKHMRPEIDPCDNFFEFVCGRKAEHTSRLDPHADRDLLLYLEFLKHLQGNVTMMLTQKSFFRRMPSWLAKAQVFYKKCTEHEDDDMIQQNRKISAALGPIFALKRWDLILGELRHKLSFSFVFDVTFSMSDKYSIDIDQGDDLLWIPREIYRHKSAVPQRFLEKRQQLQEILERLTNQSGSLLESLGIQPVSGEELDAILSFEDDLASRMASTENTVFHWAKNGYKYRYTFSQLRKISKKQNQDWDWAQYFKFWKHLFDPFEKSFVLRQPDYTERIIKLLNSYNKTTVLQYITLRFVDFLQGSFYPSGTNSGLLKERNTGHLPSGLLRTKFMAYKNRLAPLVSKAEMKTESCVNSMAEMFPATNLITLERHFVTPSIRQKVREISYNVRRTIIDLTNEIPWLKANQEFVLNKMDQLTVLMSYPQAHLRADKLDMLYANLKPLKHGTYLDNTFQYLRYFGEISMTVNYRNYVFAYYPFYVHISNTIAVQGIFLQKPHFDSQWPGYLLYSTIGHALGHEIAHGFDVNGWYFRADGTFRSEKLWPKEFRSYWENQKDCLDSHYSQYSLPSGIQVKGKQTMAENSADIFGVQIAYRAYQRSQMWHSDDHLPNFAQVLSRNQLFFVSLGRTLAYCVQDAQKDIIESSLSDTHTPGRFRLLGMLRNSPEFSAAFQCKKGSYMNPNAKRCNFI